MSVCDVPCKWNSLLSFMRIETLSPNFDLFFVFSVVEDEVEDEVDEDLAREETLDIETSSVGKKLRYKRRSFYQNTSPFSVFTDKLCQY